MANILAGLAGLFGGAAEGIQQNQARALRALQMAAQQADLYNSGVRTGAVPTGVSVTPDDSAPTDSIPSSLPWPSALPTPDVAQVSPGAQSALDGSIFSGQSPSSASPGGVAPALSKQMGIVAALRAAGGPPPSPSTTPAADSTPPAPTDASSAPNPLTGKITFANPVTNGDPRFAALSPNTYIDNENTPFAHQRTIEALKAAQAMGIAGFKGNVTMRGQDLTQQNVGSENLTKTDIATLLRDSNEELKRAVINQTQGNFNTTNSRDLDTQAQQGAQEFATQTADVRKAALSYAKLNSQLDQAQTNAEAVKPALMSWIQTFGPSARMSAPLIAFGMSPSIQTGDAINNWISTHFKGTLPPGIIAGIRQAATADMGAVRAQYEPAFTAARASYPLDRQRFFNAYDPKVVFGGASGGSNAGGGGSTGGGLVTVPSGQHLPGNPFATQ